MGLVCGLGLRVWSWGLGFRVWEFKVWSLGVGVSVGGLEFGVEGLEFRVL